MAQNSKYLSTRHQPQNVNEKHKNSLSFQDRIALNSTNIIGTMYAVYFLIIFMAGWMVWQTVLDKKPFDPYPFAFLLFLGNIVQLLLMPLIMVGQNLQGRHSEIRADEEYKTTKTSFKDIEQILISLEDQNKKIERELELLENIAKSFRSKRT